MGGFATAMAWAGCIGLVGVSTWAQAGVEARIRTKFNLPGTSMKIFGKDLSESLQIIRVNDAATLKATVAGKHTSWISLTHAAFFNETGKNCTATTFDEMVQRAQQFQEHGNPLTAGTAGSDPPEDPEKQYEIRISSKKLGPETVAGIEGASAEVHIKVLEKGTENIVSTIRITQVSAPGTAYTRINDFDAKFAKQSVKPLGPMFGLDVAQMKDRMFAAPAVRKAMEQFQAAGFNGRNTILKTTTEITSNPPSGKPGSAGADAPSTGATPGIKAKMKKMFGRFRKNRKQSETGGSRSGPQELTMKTELLELTDGVEVVLPAACQVAYKKKVK